MSHVTWDVFVVVALLVIVVIIPIVFPIVGAVRRSYAWFFLPAGALFAQLDDLDARGEPWLAASGALCLFVCLAICFCRGGEFWKPKDTK